MVQETCFKIIIYSIGFKNKEKGYQESFEI